MRGKTTSAVRTREGCQNLSVAPGPTTQYAKTGDGSQIAYQIVGDGDVDLVYLTGHLSHVDVRWEHPSAAHFLNGLASLGRLIIFDRRGLGASDHLPTDVVPTWEEWADDLRVVLDAVDSKAAVPIAIADGGPMAITFGQPIPSESARWFSSTICVFRRVVLTLPTPMISSISLSKPKRSFGALLNG